MELAIFILSILSVLGLVVGGLLARFWLPGYLSEKGKNLATKEDIHHLTDAVESIKAKYATVNQVQQIQFEKEFDTYVEIMAKLVSLQSATLALRPTGFVWGRGPETEEEQRQEKISLLTAFNKAYGVFWVNAREKRPFYSPMIWGKLDALMKAARWEAFQYQTKDDDGMGMTYWDEAEKNQEKILAPIEEVVEAIRGRFEELKAVK